MEKTPKVDWDAPVTPEDVERDVAEELSEMAGFASNWVEKVFIDSFLDGKIDALVNMMAIAHIKEVRKLAVEIGEIGLAIQCDILLFEHEPRPLLLPAPTWMKGSDESQ